MARCVFGAIRRIRHVEVNWAPPWRQLRPVATINWQPIWRWLFMGTLVALSFRIGHLKMPLIGHFNWNYREPADDGLLPLLAVRIMILPCALTYFHSFPIE